MRIAILAEVFLPKIDGVVHRTLHLIRELVRRGDEVLVICPEADGCNCCDVPVVALPSFSFSLYPEYRIGLPDQRLVEAVEDFSPDVLHYVNPFAFGFRSYDLLARAGVRPPSVFSFHTLYGEFVKQYRALRPLSYLLWWLMREYHNQTDINITVSSIIQDELTARGFHRVKFWPPAVDCGLFRPNAHSAEMRARLANGHTSKKLLLTVSRLAPEKSVGFLAGVLDQVPDACLAIVGDGPQRAELERQFAGRNVHFVGYLRGDELAASYASADAFVYASETETMGNVILEAMASGCEIVAPRAGGIPSLVTHGKTGRLYSPGNLEEAVRWTRLALSRESGPLGPAARDWVEDWDWSNSIGKVREHYQAAIRHHGQAVASTWKRPMARTVTNILVTGFKLLARGEGTPDADKAKPRLASNGTAAARESIGV